MKIILNPKYEALRGYLTRLDEHFEQEGREIHNGRNVIRTLEVDGLTLCVKRYGAPSLRRYVQQALYKQEKGKKAYFSPMLLRERGLESPESVAFVRYHHGLFGSTSYFVCLMSNYRYSMAMIDNAPEGVREKVIISFATFAARLHERGFLHKDFSSDNILYDKIDERYHFSLIDTNSMRCGRSVNIEEGCRNLAALTGNDAFFDLLAESYARERGADSELCRRLIAKERAKNGSRLRPYSANKSVNIKSVF